VVDVPDEYVGVVTERLGRRRGRMLKLANHGMGRTRLEFRVPSRGMIAFRGEFLTSTRGTGLLNTLFEGWEPWGGPMTRRTTGAIVADRAGFATPYALHHLQPRGDFFISPGIQVYEGMIIGEHNRPSDSDVNVTKEKKLSNVRNHGKDENVLLAVPRVLTIETAMDWIDADELVEVTPDAVRVRKQILACNLRPRRQVAIEEARRALDKIKEPMRSCLLLKQQGLSYKEIATTLSLKETNVGSLVARGRKEFARVYGKIGGRG